MLPSDMHIDELGGVLFGNHPFSAGQISDWSGPRITNELILKVSGQTIITVDRSSAAETAGTVRFMPETPEHSQYICQTVEPGSYYYFKFKSKNAPREMRRIQVKNYQTLERLFVRMWQVWTMKKDGWYHAALSIAYEIFAVLEQQSYLPSGQAKVLLPAMNEIERHLVENIDVSHLHELCGVSYTYFKQLFIRRYGVPPQRYITKLRMSMACEQLTMGDQSITEIAQSLGYSNVHYFSRLFKKEHGCTAGEYRRSTRYGQGEYRK